jgi:hypothetical protein
LFCRLLVNALFCCYTHLLHRQICLLLPLVLTLSLALFSLFLPWGPSDEGLPKKHLLIFHRRRLQLIFFITLHHCM